MIIAVDIDDTIAEFTPKLIEFHNDCYETSLTKDKFYSYNFWEVWGGTREEAIAKVDLYIKSKYFEEIKPISDSFECISLLRQNYDLVVITSRPETARQETDKWINRYFPNVFSEIYYAYNQVRKLKGKTKEEICIELQADFLIEDNIDHSFDAAGKGIEVILLDQPWNQSKNVHEKITRVKDWKEISKIIEAMPLCKNKL